MGKKAWDLGRGIRWTQGAMLVLGGSTNVHVLVNLASVMCVPSLLSLPAREEERTWLSTVMFYVSPLGRCG